MSEEAKKEESFGEIKLQLLHTLKVNMNAYEKGEKTPQVRGRIIEAYQGIIGPLKSERLGEVALYYLEDAFSGFEADIKEFRQKAKENEKDFAKTAKLDKAKLQEAKAAAKIKAMIAEEMAYQQESKKKYVDVAKDAEVLSIRLDESGKMPAYKVKFAQRDEEVTLNLVRGKATGCQFYTKKGLSTAAYKLINESGEFNLGAALESKDGGVKAAKSVSRANFLKLRKLKEDDVKGAENIRFEQCLFIYNHLKDNDRLRFLNVLNKRDVYMKLHRDVFAKLREEPSKLRLLADSEKILNLFAPLDVSKDSKAENISLCAEEKKRKFKLSGGAEQWVAMLQSRFIDTIVAKDDRDVWSYFVQPQGKFYSPYETLLRNLAGRNSLAISEAMNFASKDEMKAGLLLCMEQIKNSTTPKLNDTMAAEVLTTGVFAQAIGPKSTESKIFKMNQILNEFGLNVRFEEKPVCRCPGASFDSSASYLAAGRAAFEADKKTASYKEDERQFVEVLKKRGIEPDVQSRYSVHHFTALKYYGFIQENLNDQSNYVRTFAAKPWNPDLHELVHIFDTKGEFLLKKAEGGFMWKDFNALNKEVSTRLGGGVNGALKEAGLSYDEQSARIGLTIMSPVLQQKGADGKFYDIMQRGGKAGRTGILISDKQTAASFVEVPAYLKAVQKPNAQEKTGQGRA